MGTHTFKDLGPFINDRKFMCQFNIVNLILKHIEYSLQTPKQNFVLYIETFKTCINFFLLCFNSFFHLNDLHRK